MATMAKRPDPSTDRSDHRRPGRRLRRGGDRRRQHARPVPRPRRRSPRSTPTSRSTTRSTSCCTTRSRSRSPTTTRSASWSRTPGAPGRRLHLELPPRTDRQRPPHRASHGYLSKALPARDLVAALEAVHAGETVVSDPPHGSAPPAAGLAGTRRRPDRPGSGDPGADHPGQEQRRGGAADLPQPEHGQVLHPRRSTARSASTAAPRPCCGASDNGFTPDHHRIDHWRGGP